LPPLRLTADQAPRVAYLLAPDLAAEQTMRGGLQATMQMPFAPMVALLTPWLRSGLANEIIKAIRNDGGRVPVVRRALPERGSATPHAPPAIISGCRCRHISPAPIRFRI